MGIPPRAVQVPYDKSHSAHDHLGRFQSLFAFNFRPRFFFARFDGRNFRLRALVIRRRFNRWSGLLFGFRLTGSDGNLGIGNGNLAIADHRPLGIVALGGC
jgi:hypothetical protein